jgi:hypothetical protein
LFNCEAERHRARIHETTPSCWQSVLANPHDYTNILYDPLLDHRTGASLSSSSSASSSKIVRGMTRIATDENSNVLIADVYNLRFWRNYYLRYSRRSRCEACFITPIPPNFSHFNQYGAYAGGLTNSGHGNGSGMNDSSTLIHHHHDTSAIQIAVDISNELYESQRREDMTTCEMVMNQMIYQIEANYNHQQQMSMITLLNEQNNEMTLLRCSAARQHAERALERVLAAVSLHIHISQLTLSFRNQTIAANAAAVAAHAHMRNTRHLTNTNHNNNHGGSSHEGHAAGHAHARTTLVSVGSSNDLNDDFVRIGDHDIMAAANDWNMTSSTILPSIIYYDRVASPLPSLPTLSPSLSSGGSGGAQYYYANNNNNNNTGSIHTTGSGGYVGANGAMISAVSPTTMTHQRPPQSFNINQSHFDIHSSPNAAAATRAPFTVMPLSAGASSQLAPSTAASAAPSLTHTINPHQQPPVAATNVNVTVNDASGNGVAGTGPSSSSSSSGGGGGGLAIRSLPMRTVSSVAAITATLPTPPASSSSSSMPTAAFVDVPLTGLTSSASSLGQFF